MENSKPKVTFGFVNCNRLYYLKSCVSSVMKTTSSYPNLEFIVVDNASTESGTEEYLSSLEQLGVRVFRSEKRDPSNEFARGLNTVVKNSTGKYVVMLQADSQFIIDGWLEYYVDFYENASDTVGCIMLDAQRNVTNQTQKSVMSIPVGPSSDFKFVFNASRPPIAGAADVMYSRQILDLIGAWSENNQFHEGVNDSETDMLNRVRDLITHKNLKLMCAMPIYSPSVAIYTDSRGTNARVRGNKRYGDYWPAKKDDTYYQIMTLDEILSTLGKRDFPVGIEEIARPVGWSPPIDQFGSWLKNPIRPETASESDYTVLDEQRADDSTFVSTQDKELLEWLNS